MTALSMLLQDYFLVCLGCKSRCRR